MSMSKAQRNAQFEAAFERVVEAQLLMEGIAVHTTDSHAMDIQARLAKVWQEMTVFQTNIMQNLK
jgi:ABC-type phosphate transport system ATPase subunit